MVGFSSCDRSGYFCFSEFDGSSCGDEISLLEIGDLFGLYHLNFGGCGDAHHSLSLDLYEDEGILQRKTFEPRKWNPGEAKRLKPIPSGEATK